MMVAGCTAMITVGFVIAVLWMLMAVAVYVSA